jgi:type IV pilus assembly protein PilW
MIELMVAVTLALTVTTAVISMFVGSRQAFESTAGVGAVADGGRFAMDYLQQSVRNAGYYACGTAALETPLLNTVPALPYNFSQALGGFEAVGTGGAGSYSVPLATATTPMAPDSSTGDWTGNATEGAALDALLASLVVKNSDVLVVRGSLSNTQAVYVTAITDGASTFTVNAAGSLYTVDAAGNSVVAQLAVISDCAKASVMQITNLSGGASPTVTHGTGGPTPGNSAAAFPVSFGIGAQVTPVDTIVYYIGQGADGDGALFAYDLNAGTNPGGGFVATELVPDIESMQVLYGVDVNGSQTVGEYVTADAVADFNTVISVKIAVLAASPPGSTSTPATAPTFTLLGNTVTAPKDSRSRQVFEITIGVRNSAS